MSRLSLIPSESIKTIIRKIVVCPPGLPKSWGLIFILILSQTAAAQVPVANFTANNTSGCGPLVVRFTDQSTNGPTSWNWDFGNGTLSQVQNPTVTFSQPGTYSVTLVVQNANGTHGVTKTNYITVTPSPSPNFSANLTLGCVPVGIQFTDQTNPNGGTITSWEWNFGDGTTSTQQNPQKVYNTPGFYSVSLRVTSSNGCTRVISKGNYIRIVSGVTAEFSNTTPVTCQAPFLVNFSNLTSAPGNVTYQWNFGNGATSTQANPSATYAAPGTYNVTLTATSQYGCSGSIQKPVTITNTTTSFSGPDTLCLNTPATFQNTSSPAPATSLWDFGNGQQSGQVNGDVSYPTPGNYTVKLINTYSTCTDSFFKQVHVPADPVVDFNGVNLISCQAPLTANFTDISPDAVSWQWDFGDGGTSTLQNPAHTYTTPGQFNVTLTITDSKGCRNTITKPSFIQIENPTLQITNVPAGGCIPFPFAPASSVTAIDGVASWFWDFGDGTTSTLQNPPPHVYTDSGTYTLKLRITTNGGCVDSVVRLNAIRTGPLPNVDFTFNATDTCASAMIEFTDLSVPADRWEWQFGDGTTSMDQNPIHQYTDTGSFNITLTAYNNGCAAQFIHPTPIHIKPPIPDFTFLVNCNNQRQVTFTNESIVDPAYGPISYLWNFGDPANSTSTQQDPMFTYPGLGRYQVTLTVTNGSCIMTFMNEVDVVGETADFSVSKATVCKNETLTLTAINSNAQNIAAYEWSTDGGVTWSAGARSVLRVFPNTGIYDIALRITDINGCTNTKITAGAVTVTGPAANFTADSQGDCVNSVITFTDNSTANGGALSKWTFEFGDGQTQVFTGQPFSHLYADTGLFRPRLTVEDINGCTNTYNLPDTIIITSPVAKFSSNYIVICPQVDIQFVDSSKGKGLSWLWDFGDGTSSMLQNPLHNYTGPDSAYTVKLVVVDTVGCSDSVTTVNYISVKSPKPAFAVQDSSTICPPIETLFTFQGQDYESFYWDFGDSSTSTLMNPTHFYNTFGSYTAKLYLTGFGGCLDSATSIVNLYDPQGNTTVNYSPLTACNELLVDFDIIIPPSTNFTFFFGDGTTDTTQATTLQHFYGQPAFYNPSVLLTDAQHCQVSVGGGQTIRVIGAIPLFGVDRNTFCDNGDVIFTNYTIGNDPVVSRVWDFGDNTTSTDLHPVHYFAQPGTYEVSQSVTTQTGCSKSIIDTILVYGTPHPLINGNDTVCINEPLDLQGLITVPDTATTWAWNFGNGGISNNQDVTITYPTEGNYTVSLATTNLLGCADTTFKNIFVPPTPTVSFTNQPTIAVGSGVTIPATYSPNISSYTWTPATNLSCTDCPTPFANPKNTTTYQIAIEDIYGCTNTGEVTITVVCNGQNYFIPNTFSPNGDGVNDIFAPRGSGLARINSLKIFNRWGELVFERRNFMANDRTPSGGWDGTFKGKPANPDVYVYIIEFVCENSVIIPYRGNVTLVR